jgi:Flp pilus assembly secretin CpaC
MQEGSTRRMFFVWIGETMQFMASRNTHSRAIRSPAVPVAARWWFAPIAAIMVCCHAIPARAMEETLVVTIDQARVVKVRPGTETLIVGNAAIADLTLLKQGTAMIITGKGFGETNFIALDGVGSPLAQSSIRVVGGKNALLVQRGLDRESYSCAPQCLPTAKLGDDLKYFGEVSGQVKDHNAQATGLQ